MWHPDDECQVCDMFECLWHFGTDIDPNEHDIVFYPDDIGYIFYSEDGSAVCTCTMSQRCGHCIEREDAPERDIGDYPGS